MTDIANEIISIVNDEEEILCALNEDVISERYNVQNRNIKMIVGHLSIALVIVLCSDKYAAIRSGGNLESASHIETLKLSGPYGRDIVTSDAGQFWAASEKTTNI